MNQKLNSPNCYIYEKLCMYHSIDCIHDPNDLYCSGKTNTKYQDIMQFKDFNYVSILDYVR